MRLAGYFTLRVSFIIHECKVILEQIINATAIKYFYFFVVQRSGLIIIYISVIESDKLSRKKYSLRFQAKYENNIILFVTIALVFVINNDHNIM